MAESETPRTDKEAIERGYMIHLITHVAAGFARDLEMEVNGLSAELEQIRAELQESDTILINTRNMAAESLSKFRERAEAAEARLAEEFEKRGFETANLERKIAELVAQMVALKEVLYDAKHTLLHIKEVCDSAPGYPDFVSIKGMVKDIENALSNLPAEADKLLRVVEARI